MIKMLHGAARRYRPLIALRQLSFCKHSIRTMSDDTQNTNRRKFDRVNSQLNYSRKFISRHTAEVEIPTIPYEGFDVFSPDVKVKPWSLLDLIISARIFTQWPASKASNPSDSFLDVHKLLSVADQAIYFVGLQLDMSRDLYDFTTPKFPLLVQQELIYVGKSSSRKRYTLKHPDVTRPLLYCYFDDVLVKKSSGKAIPFPEWWSNKYSYVNEFNEKPVTIKLEKSYQRKFHSTFRVEFDDIDHNLHATSSTYLRLCMNSAFSNVMQSNYEFVNLNCFNAGIKTVQMQFFLETRHGDELTVNSWEDFHIKNLLHFSVMKENDICCYVKLEFYGIEDSIGNSRL